MARWSGYAIASLALVVLALVAVPSSARNVPSEAAGLNDQKNFATFGFVGVGPNGIPFGGVGGLGDVGGLGGLDGGSGHSHGGLDGHGGISGGIIGVPPIGAGAGGFDPLHP